MTFFYKGKEAEVWETALVIENSRQKKKKKERQKKTPNKRDINGGIIHRINPKDEVKRRNDRAKLLTNDGELRKAFATMVQRGVAPSNDDIVAQLREKFPLRKNKVRKPNKDRIWRLRNLVEKTFPSMKVGEVNETTKISPKNPGGIASETLLDLITPYLVYFGRLLNIVYTDLELLFEVCCEPSEFIT